MDFKELNEKLEELTELYPEDAGLEITDFENYEDALNKIYQRYKNNEALAYCPNATKIHYNNQEYSLAVVLGIAKPTKAGMNPHGMAHYMDKHSYEHENETIPTEEELLKASKNVQNALNQAKQDNNVVYNPFEHKLIFKNGNYVYIICLAKDDKELVYLHNLFIPKSKKYIKRKRKEINKQKQNEIPPYSL